MKKKKGVSPLIAAVLLIAFTVAVATLIMGWFSTITRSTTATVSNKTTEAVSCANAQISIEDVYVVTNITIVSNTTNTTGTIVRVLVKNTGYTTLGLTSLQVFNTTGQNFSTNFGTGTISVGSIVAYNISAATNMTCARFSKVIVTTNCGGIADTFDGTPKCPPLA